MNQLLKTLMETREVRGVRQKNLVFRECERLNIPFVAMSKERKYGVISYDLITKYQTSKPRWWAHLKPDAEVKIHEVFRECAEEGVRRRPVYRVVGSVLGQLWPIPIDTGRKYLPRIREVVEDEERLAYPDLVE